MIERSTRCSSRLADVLFKHRGEVDRLAVHGGVALEIYRPHQLRRTRFDRLGPGTAPGLVDSWPFEFVLAGRINLVPKPFPAEFHADVIAVARKGEAPLRHIAKDFGISQACLHRWLKIAGP